MNDEYDAFLDDLRTFAGRPMYRDRDGEPITLRQWCESHEYDDIVIAKTVTAAGEVSTVWLGIDQAIFGPPQIFETMVFETELKESPFGPYYPTVDVPEIGEIFWGSGRRYSTEEEALRGHLEIVEALGGPVVE